MSRAINWVVKNHPDRWLKKQGRDHVFTAVHDYASCFDFQRKRANKMGPLSELSNSIVLMSLGDTKSKCYNPLKDVTIPTFIPTVPTTHAHRLNSDLLMQANWKMYLGNQGPEDEDAKKTTASLLNVLPLESRSVKEGTRKILIFFWGQLSWTDANGVVDPGYSNGIRQNLLKWHKDDPTVVLHHVTREGAGSLDFTKYSSMLDASVFCLCPAGFAPWTKRLYEGKL